MKYIEESATVELSARNIRSLTLKLDDPASARTLVSGCRRVTVTVVEDAAAAEGKRPSSWGTLIPLTRTDLATLATEGAHVQVGDHMVVVVPDEAHYSSRPAGAVFMPTSGEYL